MAGMQEDQDNDDQEDEKGITKQKQWWGVPQ
jgi:hypothetical protein